MQTIGFIDYFLDEWHANNYPEWIKQASGGELQVAYAYGKIDSPRPGGLTTDDWCAKYRHHPLRDHRGSGGEKRLPAGAVAR